MSNAFELELHPRQHLGSAASRRLRREQDFVPVIMYGGDKEDPQPLQIEHRILDKALKNEAFYAHILDVTVEGKKQKAILRAVQRHPFKPKILHIDLMRVTGKQMINMLIPFHFLNEETAIGVKIQGGRVEHYMMNVEIKCRADAMPEYIEVDLAQLELNQSLHLSDLTLPKGVEIPSLALGPDQNRLIVSINAHRTSEEAETPAVTTAEAANTAAPAASQPNSGSEKKEK